MPASLVLALGRIQSLSGADQRYTAHADALSIHNAGVSVSEGNRHWAGVWDSTIDDSKMDHLNYLEMDFNLESQLTHHGKYKTT